jgi:purine-binding chemotaxis protein CheW
MHMAQQDQILIFTLNGQRYGIPLGVVEMVVRMVTITPLTGSPEFIDGVINVHGKIIPVLNLRGRFGLPVRPTGLSDQLIILRCATRSFALIADMACDVMDCTEQMQAEAAEIIPDLPFLTAVVKLPDGLILLQDPEALLSPGESIAIDELIACDQP